MIPENEMEWSFRDMHIKGKNKNNEEIKSILNMKWRTETYMQNISPREQRNGILYSLYDGDVDGVSVWQGEDDSWVTTHYPPVNDSLETVPIYEPPSKPLRLQEQCLKKGWLQQRKKQLLAWYHLGMCMCLYLWVCGCVWFLTLQWMRGKILV